MNIIVTGSLGLVGFSASKKFLDLGYEVVGIDCNARKHFFGLEGSVQCNLKFLSQYHKYKHYNIDISNRMEVHKIFKNGADIIIHAAAQPSHDWAMKNIRKDFEINTIGTLNILESVQHFCPNAIVCHFSTSKVYGDNLNYLPFKIINQRYDLEKEHPLYYGIKENYNVDNTIHSFFGCSKYSGELYAQEYGKNLGMKIGIFRPGCITGKNHAGVKLHGFLSYMSKCIKDNKIYEIIGYNGNQVRCNIHADDLIDAVLLFIKNPKYGEIYNIGGRELSCSLNEAVLMMEMLTNRKLNLKYNPAPRIGDHKWYISDASKFKNDFNWKPKNTIRNIIEELLS